MGGCQSHMSNTMPPFDDVHMYDATLTPPPSAPPPYEINFEANRSSYGQNRFMGTVAAKYLVKQGLPANLLSTSDWTLDRETAHKVAKAIIEWAKERGATMTVHCFQPLGSAGLRLGQTAGVQNAMFNFNKKGELEYVFTGDELIQGESDGSSFHNGGLRATHTAGGYTILDPTSPVFIRGDTVFIPTMFVSWHGIAIDEKTPLLKSMKVLGTQGKRLLSKLGYEVSNIIPNIGLEQEFFLIPREAYYKRPDLQFAGRTIMGRDAARGQELCDHYMAPLNQVALACMQEIMHEGFKMGCPFKTRHREVAPNQYECAPYFGLASTQIDENLVLMQLIDEIPQKHGLVGILHEKPFNHVNGSGKHNNFSLGTPEGVNLMNGPQLTAKSGNADIFPIVISAVVRAMFVHGDLFRMAIASPGNDFRLGACEAPPSIMSTYLGQQLTDYLDDFRKGKRNVVYTPNKVTVDLGIDGVAPVKIPAEDRNRTSPFPYGGHRFEFRAAGSSQNVSMINTVLCTTIAESFQMIADQMDEGKAAAEVAAEMLNESWDVIFNGNGYSKEWPIEAERRHLCRIDSGVEACKKLTDKKNKDLFSKMNVMKPDECDARATIMYNHYAGTVEIEAKCMVDMIQQHIIPSATKVNLTSQVTQLTAAVKKLEADLHAMEHKDTSYDKATAARVLRLETMVDIRKICDAVEALVPPSLWTLATYKELLFLDFNHGARAGMTL